MGTKIKTPGRSFPPAHTQHFLEATGSLSYFAFRSSKWYARPVTLPALIYCDAGYKSAGGRVLKPLFELRAQNKFKMQNADFKLLCVHCENPS
jgi:hypothetical protein